MVAALFPLGARTLFAFGSDADKPWVHAHFYLPDDPEPLSLRVQRIK